MQFLVFFSMRYFSDTSELLKEKLFIFEDFNYYIFLPIDVL